MSSIPPAELKSMISHIVQTYGEVFDRLARLEYNETMQRDSYMDSVIDSIIATVRYGEPAQIKKTILAIIELAIEHEKEKR